MIKSLSGTQHIGLGLVAGALCGALILVGFVAALSNPAGSAWLGTGLVVQIIIGTFGLGLLVLGSTSRLSRRWRVMEDYLPKWRFTLHNWYAHGWEWLAFGYMLTSDTVRPISVTEFIWRCAAGPLNWLPGL